MPRTRRMHATKKFRVGAASTPLCSAWSTLETSCREQSQCLKCGCCQQWPHQSFPLQTTSISSSTTSNHLKSKKWCLLPAAKQLLGQCSCTKKVDVRATNVLGFIRVAQVSFDSWKLVHARIAVPRQTAT